MAHKDQGAASPAQEPALKPEELDQATREYLSLPAFRLEDARSAWCERWAARLIAQARLVPPAVAPVGELRAALEPFARKIVDVGESETDEDIFDNGGRYNRAPKITAGDIRRAQAALAAAPVTGGDRETAGVGDHPVEQAARVLALSYGLDPDEDAPLSVVCSPTNRPLPYWHAYAEQALALVEAGWVLATPPSGGGDHAGGDNRSPEQRERAAEFIRRTEGAAPDAGGGMEGRDLSWVRNDQLASQLEQEAYRLGVYPDAAKWMMEAAKRLSATAAPASGVERTGLEGFTGQEGHTGTLEVEAAMEVVSMVREAAKRITGGNCTFVDDDLRALVALAASPKAQGSDVGLSAKEIAALIRENVVAREDGYGGAFIEGEDDAARDILAASRTGQKGAGE